MDALIKAVQSDTSAYASQVTVWAGNDLEPPFNPWANTSGWISGYSSVDPALYLDYGSADGCSSTSHANGSCSNGWTTSDVYDAAWGATPAEARPEKSTMPSTRSSGPRSVTTVTVLALRTLLMSRGRSTKTT